MRASRVFLTLAFALVVLAGSARAESLCCSPAANDTAFPGQKCGALAPGGTAGCVELPDGSCTGGNAATQHGCVCVGTACVSDGSVGDGPGLADARTCTRDAVAGCCENDDNCE